MQILQVHNFYQQRGGEDSVYAAECELLRQHGETVVQYSVHNDAIKQMSQLKAALRTIWNSGIYHEIRALIAAHAPDVIHAHNTFPLVSPSLYYAAASAGVPVVQTLHNYRLLCPSAILFRDGHICEECLGRIPYPAIVHNCYRDSKSASTTVAALLVAHRAAGTWRRKVSTYIALTEFAKAKFVAGGLDPRQIIVKPNFLLEDPGIGDGTGQYALFVGRLSREKGLGLLLDAWSRVPPAFRLKIAGDGDLREVVETRAREFSNVEVLGKCDRSRILELAKSAAVQIVPSEWYEGLPMTIVEAFACGTPVITSTLRSMDEIVQDRWNGARFENGSPANLADCVVRVMSDSRLLAKMRKNARNTYETTYTPLRNYSMLMNIYQQAISTRNANLQNDRPLAEIASKPDNNG
jgi:glycosyltransferase involved in cell wall biosynthesis